MQLTLDQTALVLIWCAAALFVIAGNLRDNTPRAGLILSYVVLFFAIHGLAAILSLLPQYAPLWDATWSADGFREATFGIVAFAVGTRILAPFVIRRRRQDESRLENLQTPISGAAARNFLIAGVACYFVLAPFLSRIPSVSALVSTGSNLMVMALCMATWRSWHSGRRAMLLLWLFVALSLPLMTIGTQGFLGFGTAAGLAVFGCVASFYRPRWQVLPVLFVAGYIGLSVFVMYMRERDTIRAALWYGATDVTVQDRVQQVAQVFTIVELFDPTNVQHLGMVENRLNQNVLVGASVAYLGGGYGEFAGGATLWDAALGVVPRILWPDKPVSAGSGDLVTRYTGIYFAPGTAVGIGNVGEFYVNFGTAGVVLGFLLLGVVLEWVDRAAGRSLAVGNTHGFVRWYLPGLCLLQIGGSLVDLTESVAAAIVFAYLLSMFWSERRAVSSQVLRPLAPIAPDLTRPVLR